MSLDPRPILDAPVEMGGHSSILCSTSCPLLCPLCPEPPPVARRNQKANSSPGWGRRRALRLGTGFPIGQASL